MNKMNLENFFFRASGEERNSAGDLVNSVTVCQINKHSQKGIENSNFPNFMDWYLLKRIHINLKRTVVLVNLSVSTCLFSTQSVQLYDT